MTVIGQFTAQLRRTGENVKETMEMVYIVKNLWSSLVGQPAIEALQLVSRVDSIDKTVIGITTQFLDLFTRLGKMKGEYHIQLSEEVRVVPYSLQTPHHVPIPLHPKVKAELERMKALGALGVILKRDDHQTGELTWWWHLRQMVE